MKTSYDLDFTPEDIPEAITFSHRISNRPPEFMPG
jgi:hypothetical protein